MAIEMVEGQPPIPQRVGFKDMPLDEANGVMQEPLEGALSDRHLWHSATQGAREADARLPRCTSSLQSISRLTLNNALTVLESVSRSRR